MSFKWSYGLVVVGARKTECGAQALVGAVKVGELTVDVDRDGVDEL